LQSPTLSYVIVDSADPVSERGGPCKDGEFRRSDEILKPRPDDTVARSATLRSEISSGCTSQKETRFKVCYDDGVNALANVLRDTILRPATTQKSCGRFADSLCSISATAAVPILTNNSMTIRSKMAGASMNLGLYSCESLISFSEALNSCTCIYEPNRRILSSGGLPGTHALSICLCRSRWYALPRAPRRPLQSYNTFALRLISEV
jgi:hypothetical protein